jgi:hypothetical protein
MATVRFRSTFRQLWPVRSFSVRPLPLPTKRAASFLPFLLGQFARKSSVRSKGDGILARAAFLAVALVAVAFVAACCSGSVAMAEQPSATLPAVFADDFESGADHWQPLDPPHWKIAAGNGGHVFSHFVKQGKYKPPHRSPVNIALLKDHAVEDFEYTVKVKSTHPDYGHRDAVLVFGYQDPSHFYYVHFGKQTDDHANQIFLVNDKPRVKISTKTTAGTPWDDAWHTVRVTRRVADGSIAVYYDDMEKPVMTAQDKTFTWGRIGLGSFDDTTDWDDVKLLGKRK